MKKKTFRPMKCDDCELSDLDDLQYPVLATPKIDGIRCVMRKGRARTYSLKLVPNKFIRRTLRGAPPFDGELAVGTNFQDCTSGIMSYEGKPDFRYYVFDYITPDPLTQYKDRIKSRDGALEVLTPKQRKRVVLLKVKVCRNAKELRRYRKWCLKQGYEGVVFRTPDGPYKWGRSTFKEQFALKLKPFKDAEGVIVGFVEEYENTNKKEVNEHGLTERSSKQDGFRPKGTLGAFVIRTEKWGEFKVGTGQGITKALRKHIWTHKAEFLGKLLKFKYQSMGTKDKPRIPIAIGIRDKRDL